MSPATLSDPKRAGAWVLAAAAVLAGCERPSELLGRVGEADANASLRVLREHGISAEKVYRKDGITITVAPRDTVSALDTLNAYGLPRGTSTSLGDVFKREGMVSTPLEERARLVHALSKELEGIIEAIDGVVVARVLVVLPDRALPGEPLKPPSASVFVKHRDDLDPDLIRQQIARLVGSAVPGLAEGWRERVTVVFVRAADPAPGRAHAAAAAQAATAADASRHRSAWLAAILGVVALTSVSGVMLVRRLRRTAKGGDAATGAPVRVSP